MKSFIRKTGINLISTSEFIKNERELGYGKINLNSLKLLSKGFYS